MLKLVSPELHRFYNFKCGEIFCETPTNYNVSCCLCGKKQPFNEFPIHFQVEHLSLGHLETWKPTKQVEQDDGAKTLEIPQPITEAEIKFENEEKPETVPFPMDELEDEKPIDIVKVQFGGRAKDSKSIIVESFRIESCHSISSRKSEQDNTSEEVYDNNKNGDNDEVTDAFDDIGSDSTDDSNNSATKRDDGETFPCIECKSTYKSKRGLNNHIRFKHKNIHKPKRKPPQKHKCTECGDIFPSERNLSGHMLKHTGIFCDICGKSFSQVGNMRLHKIRHSGIKAHKCSECDNTFYTEKELKAHMMRHTGILPIICEICGRRCRDHGVLTAHMRRHTGERPAKCNVCGKSFYSVYDLNVHSVTHSNLRPFKCDVCGSTFQTKKALRVHKKLHSTDRKHACKVCGKSFVQSSGLVSHMKTHDAAEGVCTINLIRNCEVLE